MYDILPFYRFLSRSRLLSAILCVSFSAVSYAALAQQQVLVTFKANDGMTFIETLRFEKVIVQGNAAPKKTLFESKGHYTVRKTASGYSVYVKPVKPVDMKVSESAAALAAASMSNMRLRYDLDAQGNLRNIAGIEQAMAEIENILPKEFRPLLGIAGITPDNMRRQIAFDWRARGLFDFAKMTGKTITLGRDFQAANAIYPSALAGAFRANGHLRTSGPLTCGKKKCIRLDSKGASKDPMLGQALAQYVRSTLVGVTKAYAPKDKQPVIPQMRVTDPYEQVSLTRIFDPTTGLQHRYIQEHDVRATIRVDEPGAAPTPIHITVKRHYTYEYR